MSYPLTNLLFFRKSHLVAFFFLLISILISQDSDGQCSVTGSRVGSSFSNNTSVGSFSWSSVVNVALSDNVPASNGIALGVLVTKNTNYLVVQNFGFAVPSTASICGVEVTIERKATGLLIGSSIKDNSIRLIKNNIISGTNMASTDNWPASDGNKVYGDVNETWGSAWTPADINAIDFGVAISAKLSSGLASLFLTAEIDQVSVRVFYNVVLPVELVNFKAKQKEEKVDFEWATASEKNNYHFIIERSANGTTGWNAIDSIGGAENSNTLLYYHASDKMPLSVGFYRLRQIDIDGHETFSNILVVRFNKSSSDLLVYPNPVGDEITVLFPCKASRILIKSIEGREVVLKDLVTLSGGVKIRLPKLQSGYYWIVIQSPQATYTKKILVLQE